MSNTTGFPYVVVKNSLGEVGLRPLLPVTLSHRGITQEAVALLDTGADVNVLPYNLGIQLGGVWDQARSGLKLSGNLSQLEARGIIISCIVGTLPPVQLAFCVDTFRNGSAAIRSS